MNTEKDEIRINIHDCKVDRRFTTQWDETTIIRTDKIPFLVEQLVTQRISMIKYIEALHDKIDWILEKNNCCDNPYCLTANCTSDHK